VCGSRDLGAGVGVWVWRVWRVWGCGSVLCACAYELQHGQRRFHTVCLNVIGGNMAMPESLDQ